MAFDSDADWDDPDPFERPATRRRPARRLSAGEDRVTAILLLVFLLVLGAILFVVVLIENLTFDANRVNNRLGGGSVLGATMWIVPGAVGLSALVTLVALLRPDRSRRIWWIPVAGAAVTVVAFLVASGIAIVAGR
ncbi:MULTISPECIES: hypothetical protein [unclassified Rathayibacter]|uniref:hypothetical protein n=1 Tax=unclassified Rathayibacter TaxID=2609250 RepID=UPI000F4D2510|nr:MULTISPECIES: hypothetical protein [unclassified Rathayibacter]ROP48701.1 hypothetical protein EDF45_2818 [Rathayibacter sp. PhB186]ROS49850.1 hypothetical protein EDF44_2820 [Rathayibacter sp. PhB185]